VACGAAAARTLGLPAALIVQPFSAAAALAMLEDRVPPGARVLVPRAADGRAELIEGLRARGVAVQAPVAYATQPVPDARAALRAASFDVLTLCSPSAVAAVVAAPGDASSGWLTPRELPPVVVCLGETTAAEARRRGLAVAAVAAETTMDSLVASVRHALAARARDGVA
jgi:uroporphyrinogen-III synthase